MTRPLLPRPFPDRYTKIYEKVPCCTIVSARAEGQRVIQWYGMARRCGQYLEVKILDLWNFRLFFGCNGFLSDFCLAGS